MDWAYFDTSVLVKRYVAEPGSTRARRILRAHRFLSSAIAPIEAVSAFRRRQMLGDLSTANVHAIIRRMGQDRPHWELISISPDMLRQAEKLILTLHMRTLDALHIASALAFRLASGMRIRFMTADRQQADAARHMDFTVEWIE
jgi:uncharacterized protein